jgi:UDP-galactopyranose mutase
MVVGAGFAGAVMAERLRFAIGKRVLGRRSPPHVGGNAYDHLDAAGVLIHQYGPHIFHTNSKEVVDYLSKFTGWRPTNTAFWRRWATSSFPCRSIARH